MQLMNILNRIRRWASHSGGASIIEYRWAFSSVSAGLPMILIVAGMSTSAGASELLIERVELCALQAQVGSLIVRIERQYAAIDAQKKSMVSRVERLQRAGWSQRLSAYLVYLAQWSIGQADIARRHLSIGSLETSLLVAYSRLGAAKDAWQGVTPEECCTDGQLREEFPPFEIVTSER